MPKGKVVSLAACRDGDKEAVLDALRRAIDRVESGEIALAERVLIVFQCGMTDDPEMCRYPMVASGMTGAQMLWIWEAGKKLILEG